ncbi:MAG: CHRD domain-containing protein [Thermoproteota archaeon]|nr:CHRD domain-containing protein [Thermoproteota archaeon]
MSIKVTLATIAIIVALGSITANGFINSALGQESFSSELTGGEEVPPVDTNATGIANLQNNVQTINYQLSVNDLVNVTQAHIHRGEEGENGKIVVTLYNTTMPTGPMSGLLSQGNITAANLVGPLAGQQLTDLVSIMDNGTAYVNVHTKDFPLGEIRGQIAGEGEADADEEG